MIITKGQSRNGGCEFNAYTGDRHGVMTEVSRSAMAQRIAELEAALMAMVDAHDPDVCWPDVMDQVKAQVAALEIARAVLGQT